jgi:hypothetical protein
MDAGIPICEALMHRYLQPHNRDFEFFIVSAANPEVALMKPHRVPGWMNSSRWFTCLAIGNLPHGEDSIAIPIANSIVMSGSGVLRTCQYSLERG